MNNVNNLLCLGLLISISITPATLAQETTHEATIAAKLHASSQLAQEAYSRNPSKLSEALLKAAEAVDTSPNDPRSNLLLGSLYLEYPDNRYAAERAEEYLYRAYELSPHDARIRFLLGKAYFMQRRFYSARELWLPLLAELSNDSELAFDLMTLTASAYVLPGHLPQGLMDVSALYKKNPQNQTLKTFLTKLDNLLQELQIAQGKGYNPHEAK